LPHLVGGIYLERSCQVTFSYLQQRGGSTLQGDGDLAPQLPRGQGSKRQRHGKEDQGQQALPIGRVPNRIQLGRQIFGAKGVVEILQRLGQPGAFVRQSFDRSLGLGVDCIRLLDHGGVDRSNVRRRC
jgi:hypothetical protein